MNDELHYLWRALTGEFGWLMAAMTIPSALRYIFKPVTFFLEKYIAQATETESAWARALMAHPAWKFSAFLLDYLASVKLPTIPKAKDQASP